MKTVGYKKPFPITNPDSLLDFDVPMPTPSGPHLLVKIRGRLREPSRYQAAGR